MTISVPLGKPIWILLDEQIAPFIMLAFTDGSNSLADHREACLFYGQDLWCRELQSGPSSRKVLYRSSGGSLYSAKGHHQNSMRHARPQHEEEQYRGLSAG